MTWLMYSWRLVLERKAPEALSSLLKLLKLTLLVEGQTGIVMAILEHIGRLNLELENFQGAIKAFQRMRDLAEDNQEKEVEMRAYKLLGKTLQNHTEHERAIYVLKRLL